MTTPPVLVPADVARMEERRRTIGTGEVSGEAEPLCGGVMNYNGPDAFENMSLGMAMDREFTEDDCNRLFAFYGARGLTPDVEICPFAHDSLMQRLGQRGLVLKEFNNVLARPLVDGEDPRAMTAHPWPEGLEIRRVDPNDDAMVRTFATTAISGFLEPGQEPTDTMLAFSARIVAHPRSSAYIAYVDGEVAGAGSMEAAAPVSALFGASVLPRFRGRGVQGALIAHRLDVARRAGCDVAVIHSKPGIATERNAARMGFFCAYTLAVVGSAAGSVTDRDARG